MTIKVVTTTEDMARVTAEVIFEEMRDHAHKLDEQLQGAGMDDSAFLLMLLARLSSYTTQYAVYMAAGLYLTTNNDNELARGAAKAVLKDCKTAAKAGLERAERQARVIRDEERGITESVNELLKRAGGKCH